MTRLRLHTFGDGNCGIRMAAKRLSAQGDVIFDTSYVWNLKKISEINPDFAAHRNYILNNPRGLGNWIWKPYILLAALESSDENDLIFLIDAGCQFNFNFDSILRLLEYCEIANSQNALFMQLRDFSFGLDNLKEIAWTKRETLEKLDPASQFTNTNQIQSGIVVMKNCPEMRDFVSEWISWCCSDSYTFLRSPDNLGKESDQFVDHRWEQSILSLLVKKYNLGYIADETFFAPDWKIGRNYPIWALRNRSGGDCIRRNTLDLIRIALAKFEREILVPSYLYRIFLAARIRRSTQGRF